MKVRCYEMAMFWFYRSTQFVIGFSGIQSGASRMAICNIQGRENGPV